MLSKIIIGIIIILMLSNIIIGNRVFTILWVELIILYIISLICNLSLINEKINYSIWSIYILSFSGLETSIFLLILTLIL